MRKILSQTELSKLKSEYEIAQEHTSILADRYGITEGSLRTIASRESWKRSTRNVKGRSTLPSDRLEDVRKWWTSFDEVKDIARRVGLDTRTTKKLCEQAFGERDEKEYFRKRNETIVKLWNAGSTLEELAPQFWLSPGSVRTLLSDAKRAGTHVRKVETKPVYPPSTDASLSSPRSLIGHNRRPRKPKAAELTDEQWEDALQRFERGEAVSSWSGQSGLPTIKQWHGHIERYPEFATRARAAMARHKVEREASIDWESAMQRFEHGERILDFSGQPGMPDHNGWFKKISTDPEYRARALKARTGHNPLGGLAGRERWQRFDNLLQQGTTTLRAATEVGMTAAAVQARRTRHSDYKEHYDSTVTATYEARRAQLLAEYSERFANRSGLSSWNLLEAIHKLPAEVSRIGSISRAAKFLGIGKALLRYQLATNHALRDLPSIERVAKEAKAAITEAKRKRREAEDRERRRQAREANAVPIGYALTKQLRQNEVYAAIDKVLPDAMDPDARMDILSSMMLAVLDGSLPITDVGSRWKSYRTAYYRDFNWNSHVSLDERIGDDEGSATRGDFISSKTPHF
jgi:DNA-binding CsgD family transcriptional regulator